MASEVIEALANALREGSRFPSGQPRMSLDKCREIALTAAEPFFADAARMREALEQWKCDACGGSGEYLNKALHYPADMGAPVLHEDMVPCKRCEGHGLHPLARTALAEPEPMDPGEAQGNAWDFGGENG